MQDGDSAWQAWVGLNLGCQSLQVGVEVRHTRCEVHTAAFGMPIQRGLQRVDERGLSPLRARRCGRAVTPNSGLGNMR